MRLRNFKKYLIAVNVAVLALALPLFWGAEWLQTNILQDWQQHGQADLLVPMYSRTALENLDLAVYDNFSGSDSPRQFENMVVERINGAREEIVIAMYSFNLASIKDALLAARERGVKITFLIAAANEKEIVTFWSDAQAKIPLIPVGENIDSKYYSMHHKFMIIDPDTVNRRMLTGTWNWTDLQEDLDPNLLMETTNIEIIESYLREADRLVNGHNAFYKFKLSDYRPWSDAITFPDARLEIWFSPGRDKYSIQNRILSLIEEADQSIDIANTMIDSEPVAQSLLAQARKGVKIRVIFDQLSVYGEQSVYQYLNKIIQAQQLNTLQLVIGGELRANELGQYSIFHHHFMVLDNRKVLTGTANWSYGGFFLNDEDFLVIESAKLAETFTSHFEYYFRKYQG